MKIGSNRDVEDQPEASLSRFEPPIDAWSSRNRSIAFFTKISPNWWIFTQTRKLKLEKLWDSVMELLKLKEDDWRVVCWKNLENGRMNDREIGLIGRIYRETGHGEWGTNRAIPLAQADQVGCTEDLDEISLNLVENWTVLNHRIFHLFTRAKINELSFSSDAIWIALLRLTVVPTWISCGETGHKSRETSRVLFFINGAEFLNCPFDLLWRNGSKRAWNESSSDERWRWVWITVVSVFCGVRACDPVLKQSSDGFWFRNDGFWIQFLIGFWLHFTRFWTQWSNSPFCFISARVFDPDCFLSSSRIYRALKRRKWLRVHRVFLIFLPFSSFPPLMAVRASSSLFEQRQFKPELRLPSSTSSRCSALRFMLQFFP